MPNTQELIRTARAFRSSAPQRDDALAKVFASSLLGQVDTGFSGNAYQALLQGTPQAASLPRDIDAYLQGAFGPLEPIMPMPIDSGEEEAGGRPMPRRTQYPVAWNLPVGIPGSEGLKVAPFQVMRAYAERYSVVRACIRVRRDEMIGMDWDISPTKPAQRQMRFDTKYREDWMMRRNECLAFWRRPDPDYVSFSSWFGALLEELFVTDSTTLFLHPPRRDKRGFFGSNMAALDLIDGTTIRPLYDIHGGRPQAPNPAYQAYYWGVPRLDLMQVFTEEQAEEAATDVIEYQGSQIIYAPYWRRVWTPYGFSPVEQAMVPNAIGLSRQVYFLDYFQEGSIPGAYIVPGVEVTSSNQRKQLQDALNAIAGDIGYKFRIIVLPAGSSVHERKDVKLADGSDNTIAEFVMMLFGVNPEEISMVPGGKSSALGGSSHADSQAETKKQARQRPLGKWLKDNIFDYVIQQIGHQYDMQLTLSGLEDEEDILKQAQTNKIYIDDGVFGRDEVRDDLGKEPWSLPMTASPTVTGPQGIIPLDPGVPMSDVQAGAAGAPPPAAPAGPGAGPTPGGPPASGKDSKDQAKSADKLQDRQKKKKGKKPVRFKDLQQMMPPQPKPTAHIPQGSIPMKIPQTSPHPHPVPGTHGIGGASAPGVPGPNVAAKLIRLAEANQKLIEVMAGKLE